MVWVLQRWLCGAETWGDAREDHQPGKKGIEDHPDSRLPSIGGGPQCPFQSLLTEADALGLCVQ